MSLSPVSSNITEVPFVVLAMQTQEEINRAYMRKMNRDYAAHIPNPAESSPHQTIKLVPISYPVPEWFNSEQESS